MQSGKSSPKPDLTETLIVLLLSAAITMFVFWIASVRLGQENFPNVPQIFKSVWASLTAGGVGVVGAIAKAFNTPRRDHPNYLLYIGITTVLMLIPIAAIIYHGDHTDPRLPSGAHLIITNGESTRFQLEDAQPMQAVSVVLKGSYKTEGQRLEGSLTSGILRTNGTPANPVHVSKIVFSSCSQGGAMPIYYPPYQTMNATIDVDLTLSPNEKLDVPPGSFHFDLPNNAILSQSWLCATLIGEPNFNYWVH
jgi:hypothetical protein